MRKLLLLLFLCLLTACADEKSGTGEMTDFIPENAAVVLNLQNPDLFFNNLKNNEFLKGNEAHPLAVHLAQQLSLLKLLPHKDPAYLVFSAAKDNSLEFLFISKDTGEVVSLDSIQNRQVETFTSESIQIKKYTLEGQVAFLAKKDSLHILSSSKELLEISLKKEENIANSADFQKAMKAASKKKPTVFINHKEFPHLLKSHFSEEVFSSLRTFSNWTALDIDLDRASIKLNGISTAGDTLPALLNVFKGVGLSQNTLASLAPANSAAFVSVTFQDAPKLLSNLGKFRGENAPKISSENALFDTAVEAGTIQLEEGAVFVLRTLDIEAARLSLDFEPKATETFREIDIFEYPYHDRFQKMLQPLVSTKNLQYFAFLEPYILFSETPEALKEVITAYRSEQVLGKSKAYAATSESLSSEASLLAVTNNIPFKKVLLNELSEGKKQAGELNFKNHPITAIQFINQSDFAHVHAVLAKNEEIKTEKATSQVAAITLGAQLATKPVFFKNHRTNGMDVAVQDIANILYLISPTGKIYWKKKLESRILGEIHSVDILRNGRFQLAFATQNKVHVIDREGNMVKPFPLNFRDQITQPLAVFDYDSKRDYRFVVVQGKEILMYDRKGKQVKGFQFSKAAAEVVQPPKHIRIGRKDYILVPESSGQLNILSRTGKIRIPVKENLDFSENGWYEYNGNFTSSNDQGQLLKISEQGKVSKENLNLADNHKITATEKTLVSLSENQLNIKGNTAQLDFGLYTEPQIFYLNNKIYVSVTDLQVHKVYLFDSNAKLLPGFPVYGSSSIDLNNADGDSALELVVQGEDDGVLVYEVN